ncbi:MAG: hypothetical protein BWY85_00605 [Firmicutes bacterium ADurb.Bin506]|nr:MAG: hypothetical protein BWY85_00605 [Firmicutes bacterium ADurb.Bin506]
MRLPRISIRVALISAAAVVALLAAGFTGYRVFGVVEPIERAIAQIDEVVSCEVESVRGGTVLTVRLKGVADLADTVNRIAQAASRGNRGASSHQLWLDIEGSPDPSMIRAMRELDFWVHEALATGKFTQLPRAATLIKASTAVDKIDVSVDSDYIYVSMANDGAEEYRLIPRAARPEGVAEPRGGVRLW